MQLGLASVVGGDVALLSSDGRSTSVSPSRPSVNPPDLIRFRLDEPSPARDSRSAINRPKFARLGRAREPSTAAPDVQDCEAYRIENIDEG